MASDAQPAAGQRAAKKEVDPRMHSAEHILTATLMAMIGCGRPFTTHLEKKKSKADYHFTRALTPAEMQVIDRRLNAVIVANLPVWEEFLPRAQAELIHDLRRLPDTTQETIRIVHIGDYDVCPCSGEHVPSTREIGAFRIVSTTYDQGTLRVRFRLDPCQEDQPLGP